MSRSPKRSPPAWASPVDRADDEAGELHLARSSGELTRRDRRVPATRDRRVQEKDGEDRSHRERDDEPRRTGRACHAEV